MKLDPQFPILLSLFALIIIAVIGFRYYEYVLRGDFMMNVYAPCDPSVEKCFVSDCSPADDLSCPIGPYKKVEVREGDAPRCLEEHQCASFTCAGIASCTATYCSDATLEDGESCTP